MPKFLNAGYAGVTTTVSSYTENFVGKRRPWPDFFDYSAISRPISNHDAMARIKLNLNYFRVNYSMVMLLVIFLSLIYHPISIIVFLIVFVAWFFLFFFRDEGYPVIMVFDRVVDDRVVLIGLSLLTVIALVFTDVGLNVVVSLVIVVSIVVLHSMFRSPDGLFLDEEEAVEDGLVSVVGSLDCEKK